MLAQQNLPEGHPCCAVQHKEAPQLRSESHLCILAVSPESPRNKACYALVHEAASLAGNDYGTMSGGAARRAPPAKLVLSGDVQHRPECLGLYRLVAGREAHGWPVWKHVSKDKWIARVADGRWTVQREQDVGVNAKGYMQLEDRRQVLPHECSGEWEEWDGRGTWIKGPGWIGAPQVKCAAASPVAPAQQVLASVYVVVLAACHRARTKALEPTHVHVRAPLVYVSA